MRQLLVCILLATSCARQPKPPVDPDLAARLPPNAAIVAGLDIDRLRRTPLFPKLPESFRDASYVLAGYDPPNLVTASRIAGRVSVGGSTAKGAPPDLLRHAATTPVWIAARGDANLPLTGNLANLNRLLRQTAYTRVTADVGERIDFAAEGVCRAPEAAAHLEQNVRAIASLMGLTVDVRRDGSTVHVTGSVPIDAVTQLF